MGPQRLNELEPRRRRRLILHSVLVIIFAWVSLIGLYYLVPFDAPTVESAAVRILLGGAAFVIVMVWLVRRIIYSEHPQMRAIEAIGVIIPLFVVVCAGSYLFLGHIHGSGFSEPLNHSTSLYFTVTVLSTVGFGDITPTSTAARLMVTGQMLLDLVLVGTVIRLVASAASKGLARAASQVDPENARQDQG